MKLFHAKYAQTRPGGVNILEDDFYLPDVHSVRRQLRNKGFWPISIREQKAATFEWMMTCVRALGKSSFYAPYVFRAFRLRPAPPFSTSLKANRIPAGASLSCRRVRC